MRIPYCDDPRYSHLGTILLNSRILRSTIPDLITIHGYLLGWFLIKACALIEFTTYVLQIYFEFDRMKAFVYVWMSLRNEKTAFIGA